MESKKSSVIPTILAIIIGLVIVYIGYRIQPLNESRFMHDADTSYSRPVFDSDTGIDLLEKNVYSIRTTTEDIDLGVETAINAINMCSTIIYYCTGWIIIAIGLAVIAIAISKR